ncbi:MAG: tRNA (guanosine(46)-N7)-methyltransferase TrmB [Gammaproteobacteria bacterium]|nr:tRNA (guanosine(46)-N7)-methyltransferase TrmB [Gammaproteobacteria bacterium]
MPERRRVRSFVRREGRLTPAQRRALETLLPRYGLQTTPPVWDLVKVFGRDAQRTLEIGFGNGENLLALARAHADQDFIGIEVHRPGVGYLLNRLASEDVANMRVICDDAQEVLKRCMPDASLDRVLLYFPDPWPKKRHHKRRLVQPEFVTLLAAKLKAGGLFHAATDWPEYAQHMTEVLSAAPEFSRITAVDAAMQGQTRSLTRFERRGIHLGHTVRELAFKRR